MTLPPDFRGNALVVHGHSVLYEVSQGHADARTGTQCTAATRFQIASVSKQFTAAAIMLLVERGAVALDHEVSRWIRGCPPTWRGITVHHLLTHTSGLGHWEDFPALDLTAWLPPDEVLKTFHQSAPKFPAGADWYYSSPAYVLLAHIVEQAGGEPYRRFLGRHIFEPLDLRDTFAGSPGDRSGRSDRSDRSELATGYAGTTVAPSFELDAVGMGAGDIWSTTGDLLRWDQALATDGLLGSESRRLLFTSHAPTGFEGQLDAYGYGWQLGRIAGHAVRCHSGDNAGFKAFNAWFPDLSAYVIVLANNQETDPYALTLRLTEAHLTNPTTP
ncbi:beta-lactamase family protein [Streptomyces sp. A7024]|uniref:Beta-lactamase family protein n=1 Tax=Streptomyces coryli TaxID=1128680 RepID=A0A6G4U0X0_9ACTN|nr:serine hydrolase domain-containing protein [Streptomyces coryli]NGN64927.1 beta-lactamase family protein [Streptomyces coryli]